MVIDHVQFNMSEAHSLKKNEFFEIVTGNIDMDKEEAWIKFSKEAEKYKGKDVKKG